MALHVRKTPNAVMYAVAESLNATRRALTQDTTTYPHCDVTSLQSGDYTTPASSAHQVTATDASSLATLRTLCRDLYVVGAAHFADAVAHVAADTDNDWGTKPATDAALSALQTWLNARKVDLNAHFLQSGVHFTNDTTRLITSADATDQSSSDTLANEIKADLNAHITAALAGSSIKLIPV